MYQERAARVFISHTGRSLLPWSWITTECELTDCLDVRCMVIHAPKQLAYPAGVCIYCGLPSGTKDHLLPLPITGSALRGMVIVVPACADCNNRINDCASPNVSARREVAHASIKRKYTKLLSVPDKTAADLRELGPGMRSVALKNNSKRASIRARLAWPDDPFMDLRAFQKAGIEDPVALGMCNHPFDEEAA